jgi:hypothetical protein
MTIETEVTTAHPSPLWQVMSDLQAANVRATPLNILARATDVRMTDADISLIVDELAAGRGLDQVAA